MSTFALEVLSPSLLDLIRSPKRDSVDRLVPEMIRSIKARQQYNR